MIPKESLSSHSEIRPAIAGKAEKSKVIGALIGSPARHKSIPFSKFDCRYGITEAGKSKEATAKIGKIGQNARFFFMKAMKGDTILSEGEAVYEYLVIGGMPDAVRKTERWTLPSNTRTNVSPSRLSREKTIMCLDEGKGKLPNTEKLNLEDLA